MSDLSEATPSAAASGDRFLISTDPIAIGAVYELADTAANGAVVLMSGMVRNQTGGRAVAHLDYQAYEPMALAVFQQIARAMRARWPNLNRIVIHHRSGRLEIGAISVAIAVGAPHRAAAFEACRYAIDTLKHQAPVWKKEHWADGGSDWVVTDGASSGDRPQL